MNIDYERLRRDLIDYYGTATFSGFGMAMIEISRVENASNEELVYIAKRNGFCLENYEKSKVRRKY